MKEHEKGEMKSHQIEMQFDQKEYCQTQEMYFRDLAVYIVLCSLSFIPDKSPPERNILSQKFLFDLKRLHIDETKSFYEYVDSKIESLSSESEEEMIPGVFIPYKSRWAGISEESFYDETEVFFIALAVRKSTVVYRFSG